MAPSLILRPYQQAAFENRTNGLECWLWGRQTGKSLTLAAWAVDRLISRPGRLVTILSNSLANGAELNHKCAEIARIYERALASPRPVTRGEGQGEGNLHIETADLSGLLRFECMNYETRLRIGSRTSRIKILPANPRTARGFSGDLILDEFAFHENSAAIWEAAEPILSANPDYLCRIASTPNGRHNMFYRLVTDPAITVRKVPRSEAWRQGLQIFHPVTREPINPDQARALAHDKRAYDQNYECIFESENMTLLTLDLISAAEDPTVGLVCDDHWSRAALAFLNPARDPDLLRSSAPSSLQCQMTPAQCSMLNEKPTTIAETLLPSPGASTHTRNLFVGIDVGRSHDLTVITVLEKQHDLFLVRGILRLRNTRLPDQQKFLEQVCRSPRFAAAHIDMTGLGLGLYEYTSQKFGDRIRGVNFACSIPFGRNSRPSGSDFHRVPNIESRNNRVPVPEALALLLLQTYEGKRIRHPIDPILRDDLRKPERVTTQEGRVSIVASRSESGHADHFWSIALALDAAQRPPPAYLHVVHGLRPDRIERDFLI